MIGEGWTGETLRAGGGGDSDGEDTAGDLLEGVFAAFFFFRPRGSVSVFISKSIISARS